MRKLNIALQMPVNEQCLLLRAIALLLLVKPSLHVLGLRRFQRLVGRRSKSTTNGISCQADFQAIQRVSHLVERVAEHIPYAPTCLQRSLVLQALLRQQNIPAHLCIGVNRNLETLVAHAWVEVDAYPINDHHDIAQYYAVLARLP